MKKNNIVLRSNFSVGRYGTVIAVIDDSENTVGKHYATVTNDADNVVPYLFERYPDVAISHIVYRDTRGVWDELLFTGKRFSGYHSLNCSTVEEAVEKASKRGHA